jgi:hypothetical protein
MKKRYANSSRSATASNRSTSAGKLRANKPISRARYKSKLTVSNTPGLLFHRKGRIGKEEKMLGQPLVTLMVNIMMKRLINAEDQKLDSYLCTLTATVLPFFRSVALYT